MGRWNARRRAGAGSGPPAHPVTGITLELYEGSLKATVATTENLTATMELIDVSDGGVVVETLNGVELVAPSTEVLFSYVLNLISWYKVRCTVPGFDPVESAEIFGS